MKLNYRENFELITGLGIVCSISIQDKTIFPILDTWSDGLINLTEKDFNEWSTLYPKGTPQKVSIGYKETAQEEESLTLPGNNIRENKDRRCLCREESISETFCFRKETIGLRHFVH